MALTFDDGPWPHTTAQILTLLAQRRAPATFFVVGRQVQRYPDLVRQELAAGMAIGSHSWSHPQPFDRLPMARIRDEITHGRRILEPLGVRPVGFRPPGGAASATVLAAAQGLGERTVLWSVDPADWHPGVTADQLVQRWREPVDRGRAPRSTLAGSRSARPTARHGSATTRSSQRGRMAAMTSSATSTTRRR